MVILKDYQRDAINKLIYEIENHKLENRILFIAPTGAGKTVMGGALIEELYNKYKDICFIWLSIGKSGLHEQSKDKINKMYPKLTSYSPTDIITTNKIDLDNGEVLFMNWESVATKNKTTGEWQNIFMRDGETQTLPKLISNTKLSNKKIFILVDEAHSKGTSSRSEEIIDIISPYCIINITATPRKIQFDQAKGQVVRVDSSHVISEGVIKKSIIVNKGIKDNNNIIHSLTDTAIRRREQLKKLYQKENSNVNPLCIIQVPNGTDGDIITKEVTEYLDTRGINEQNGKLAIWVTNNKVNLDMLENINATQEYLIFKQAIDTGWDCPRAQILLKFRDISSETFKAQLLGRISRMPELKHYRNDILNHAYVFTNEDSFIIDKPEELPESIQLPTEIIKIKDSVKDRIIYEIVPTFSKPKISSITEKQQLMYSFTKYLCEKMDYFIDSYEKSPGTINAQIPMDLTLSLESMDIVQSSTKEVKIPSTIIKTTIFRLVNSIINNEQSSYAVLDYIINLKPESMKIYDFLCCILYNITYIEDKLRDLYEFHTSTPTVKVEELDIIFNSIPLQIYVDNPPFENPQFEKLIYKYFPKERLTGSDYKIIEYLEKSDEVDWWMYNKVFNAPIQIPFVSDSGINMYRPSFITKKNNKIIIIDYIVNAERYEVIKNLLELWKYKAMMSNYGYELYNGKTLDLSK